MTEEADIFYEDPKRRKSGYYWVKLSVRWEIAHYSNQFDCWFYWGSATALDTELIKQIDETRIVRDQPL